MRCRLIVATAIVLACGAGRPGRASRRTTSRSAIRWRSVSSPMRQVTWFEPTRATSTTCTRSIACGVPTFASPNSAAPARRPHDGQRRQVRLLRFGSQLADAVEFIRTHRVVLITLSIGGDNVLRCFDLATFSRIDRPASAGAPGHQDRSSIQILDDLRAEAGPDVPIVGMNYYDPFLAASTLGRRGDTGGAVRDTTNCDERRARRGVLRVSRAGRRRRACLPDRRTSR